MYSQYLQIRRALLRSINISSTSINFPCEIGCQDSRDRSVKVHNFLEFSDYAPYLDPDRSGDGSQIGTRTKTGTDRNLPASAVDLNLNVVSK